MGVGIASKGSCFVEMCLVVCKVETKNNKITVYFAPLSTRFYLVAGACATIYLAGEPSISRNMMRQYARL